MTKDDVQQLARELGIDRVGVTTCERLDATLPSHVRPSQISEYLPVFCVLAKHIPVGISGAADTGPKQIASGLVHRVLEKAAADLAYELEAQEYMAVVLPSLIMDFKTRDELDNTPAGQGSLYLRLAAVEAGLGTLGLNDMLLTPEFGPRVYLCGMMTNLGLEPDTPLADELCLGLEACGRCAAICPADAIPRSVPRGTPLSAYRGLDRQACSVHSQPYGVGAFVDYMRGLVTTDDEREIERRIASPDTSLLWFNMTVSRQGAFTGCSRCLQVCPIGADYDAIQSSPHRQRDLPADLQAQITDDLVHIQNFSVPISP